jgi:hypothetical protein
MHVSNARSLFLICSVLISTIAFISTAEITMIAATSPGAQIAINETGQFVGNVSETIAENPISTNITGETQEYFADKAK